jgi:hypothetical protein
VILLASAGIREAHPGEEPTKAFWRENAKYAQRHPENAKGDRKFDKETRNP